MEIILSVIEMDQFQRSVIKYYCERNGFDYEASLREIESFFGQNVPYTPSVASTVSVDNSATTPTTTPSVFAGSFAAHLQPSKSVGSKSGESNPVAQFNAVEWKLVSDRLPCISLFHSIDSTIDQLIQLSLVVHHLPFNRNCTSSHFRPQSLNRASCTLI